MKDYGVGELLVQYVGQVQTKPSLIGYIEGAPPLPSENLTVDSPITPYKYLAGEYRQTDGLGRYHLRLHGLARNRADVFD